MRPAIFSIRAMDKNSKYYGIKYGMICKVLSIAELNNPRLVNLEFVDYVCQTGGHFDSILDSVDDTEFTNGYGGGPTKEGFVEIMVSCSRRRNFNLDDFKIATTFRQATSFRQFIANDVVINTIFKERNISPSIFDDMFMDYLLHYLWELFSQGVPWLLLDEMLNPDLTLVELEDLYQQNFNIVKETKQLYS